MTTPRWRVARRWSNEGGGWLFAEYVPEPESLDGERAVWHATRAAAVAALKELLLRNDVRANMQLGCEYAVQGRDDHGWFTLDEEELTDE